MCIGRCIDMCIGMCIGRCIDMCIGRCIDMCIGMCIDMHRDMCQVWGCAILAKSFDDGTVPYGLQASLGTHSTRINITCWDPENKYFRHLIDDRSSTSIERSIGQDAMADPLLGCEEEVIHPPIQHYFWSQNHCMINSTLKANIIL